MSDSATSTFSFETLAPLALDAAFDGGRLTSDGGLPWLARADARLGVCGAIAAQLNLSIANLLPAGAIYFSMDEADVQRILGFEHTMIGSDGLPHDGAPHPRLWGTFPRVLGHYSRRLNLFPLETAVHKMTGLTARTFGLADRGVLKQGFAADIVVFDENEIDEAASFACVMQEAPSAKKTSQ